MLFLVQPKEVLALQIAATLAPLASYRFAIESWCPGFNLDTKYKYNEFKEYFYDKFIVCQWLFATTYDVH